MVVTAKRMGIAACVLAVLLLAVALVSGGVARSASAPPQVIGAWVKLPVVPGRPAAGYLTVSGAGQDDRLLSVASPKTQRIELHRTSQSGGVMRMEKQESFAVPARGSLAFAPRGNHLMLFGLDPGVKPGATLPLTLRFERAGNLTVQAMVHAATDQPMEGHHHH